MNTLQLVTGNRNFSSSSLRAWLFLKHTGLLFEEIPVKLYQPDTAERLGPLSPSLKVPVLIHGDMKIWDSLAICDYISETFLDNRGWPLHLKKRYAAKSITAELHADFATLEHEWPMNCALSARMRISEELAPLIARLDAIAYGCRQKYGDGGPYLFGDFSIADCFMAPFAISLMNYGAQLNRHTLAYFQVLLDCPHMEQWLDEAQEEQYEAYAWEKTA
jgi:glutathione S-transferase